MVVFTLKILREMRSPHDGIVYSPEDYAAAGGELLVLAMVLSWALTFAFNPKVVESNPLKDRVGYNNLCVGWDTPPAKYVAGPIFCMIIFVESRFMQLDWNRADLDKSVRPFQRKVVMVGNLINALSWFASIGIFVIDPRDWPAGHSMSFVQLVVFGYVAYLLNFVETDPKYHPRGSWIFTAFFGVVCVMFGICATLQMFMYDPVAKKLGPVPWQLMVALDYGYFSCMAIQGAMRPAAPSVRASYELVSDEDFSVVEEARPNESPRNLRIAASGAT